MNLRIRKELERILKGLENAEQFDREYPWKEKGKDYTTSFGKTTFNEVKKHLPDGIKYVVVVETPNCYTVTFWR